MKFFVIGLSYRTTPVALREQLAVAPNCLSGRGCELKAAGGLDEVVLLSTCNRVEIYAAAPRRDGNGDALFESLTRSPCALSEYLYLHEDAAALAHLFAVAGGLDSMVLGETEITGQVKHAYENARAAGMTGRILNPVFQKALQTAKEIRTHTGIGRGATSIGSVAVEVAEKIFGRALAEQTVLIVGAGQMGEACVRHLAKKGAKSLLVSNRSFERAESLATEFGGRAVRFDDYLTALAKADIVITSTGCPHWLLNRVQIEKIMPARCNRPLFLIDISVPRNIDPAVLGLDNVYLYNIDDLEAIVRQNVGHREQALAACQQIIARNVAALLPRLAGVRQANDQNRPQPGWAPSVHGAVPSWLAVDA